MGIFKSNPFEKYDSHTFSTDYNDYTLVIHTNLLKNKAELFLYVGTINFFSFFGKHEPVRTGKAGPHTNMEALVHRMLTDYEVMLYQNEIIEDMEKEIEIDYAEELRKRREKLQKLNEGKKNVDPYEKYIAPEIRIWNENTEKEKEETEPSIDQRVIEIANKHGMNPNSVANLPQFRKSKLG